MSTFTIFMEESPTVRHIAAPPMEFPDGQGQDFALNNFANFLRDKPLNTTYILVMDPGNMLITRAKGLTPPSGFSGGGGAGSGGGGGTFTGDTPAENEYWPIIVVVGSLALAFFIIYALWREWI